MSWLSDRNIQSRIPKGELSYAASNFQSEVHSRVIKAFLESGLSQRDLAERLDKNPGQISRMLGGVGNWTLETVAHLIYAIEGNLVTLDVVDPDAGPPPNYTQPHWLTNNFGHINEAYQTSSRSFPAIKTTVKPGISLNRSGTTSHAPTIREQILESS